MEELEAQLKAERSRLRALTSEQTKAEREKEAVLLDLRRTESVRFTASWCIRLYDTSAYIIASRT